MGRNESDWSNFPGWFTGMGTDGNLCPKKWLFLLVWVEVCQKKLAVSYLSRQSVRAGFLEEMLAISSKKYSFGLVFSFFGYYIFIILPKYHLKGRFSLKKHLKLP